MKKILYLLALIVVFGSCSSEYSIVKRKYSNGYYISKSEHVEKKGQSIAIIKNKDLATNETEETNTELTSIENKSYESPVASSINPQQPKNTNAKTKENKPSVNTKIKTKVANAVAKRLQKNLNDISKSNTAGEKRADANTVLLVILCLLWWLNLIAVYIHDGGITMNFWITLLLNFTFIGGVIFSILVVLDIVDLG